MLEFRFVGKNSLLTALSFLDEIHTQKCCYFIGFSARKNYKTELSCFSLKHQTYDNGFYPVSFDKSEFKLIGENRH